MKLFSFDFEYDRENGHPSRQLRFCMDNDIELRVFYKLDDSNSILLDHIKEDGEVVTEYNIEQDTYKEIMDACYRDYEFRREQLIYKNYPTLNHTVEQLRSLLGNDRKL